ncbi:nuclear transport factor 2 family protein, partial [Mycolicibacterium sphagni]
MTDRDDIVDVLTRYATGIDSRDWTLFRSCFTDDAHFDYGAIGQWQSPEAITAYMRASHSGPSMHRLTNFVIVVDGDTATARTYVDAVVMGPKGLGAIENFGWYDDQLV